MSYFCNLSQFTDDVTFGVNKAVISSRGGNSYLHKYYFTLGSLSEFFAPITFHIYATDASYSKLCGLWLVFNVCSSISSRYKEGLVHKFSYSMHRQFLPHQVQLNLIPIFDNWPLRLSVPLWCDTRKKLESFASQWHGRILQLFFWKWQPLPVKIMPNSDSTNPNTQCWTLMRAQSARVAGFIRPAQLWV